MSVFVCVIFYSYSSTMQSLMVVQFPCSASNRAVEENHRAVPCDFCDSWVHIGCSNLNVYIY